MPTLSNAQKKQGLEQMTQWWEAAPKFSADIFRGEVVSWAHVTDQGSEQKMQTRVVGLHPRSCEKGLRRISLYEQYKQHMSFVTASTYHEKTQLVSLTMEHTLLPYAMILQFKLPRITSAGDYPFHFPGGIFKDLRGTIRVKALGNRCLYFLEADWQGKSTGLPNIVVEAFAQTLVKLGLEHLIRISSV